MCFAAAPVFCLYIPQGGGLLPPKTPIYLNARREISPRPTGMTQLYARSALYSSLKVSICPDSIV